MIAADEATFWGLSATAWVAIGTVTLAIVAAAALIANGRAGHHAKRSAEAAERAAEASRDAAAATRAAVEVDFDCQAIVIRDLESWVRIGATRAPVWLHSVHLNSVLDETGYRTRDDCPIQDPLVPPVFVHAGNVVLFHWPGAEPVGGEFQAFLSITYSFEPDGAASVVTRSAVAEVIHPPVEPT